jgi:hypothetical protein
VLTIAFQVTFEDGDEITDLEHWEVMTEDEYKNRMDEEPPTCSDLFYDAAMKIDKDTLSPEDLHQQRCKTCPRCEQADCGKCSSCCDNQGSTTIRKKVCLHKVSATLLSRKMIVIVCLSLCC